MRRTFADFYREWCQQTEAELVGRLGRPLTAEESGGIWNVGSLMMLEVLERTFGSIEDAAELSRELVAWGQRHEERLKAARERLIESVVTKLRRPVSEAERTQLLQVPNVAVVMDCLDDVAKWKWWRRKAEFQRLLDKLRAA